MNTERHSQPMRDALKLAGITSPQGELGESRRKAAILNDAFSQLRLYWAFKAYETQRGNCVGIQFRADGAEQIVEVDATRFMAFLKAHHRHHEIRAALVRKLEQQRSKIHP